MHTTGKGRAGARPGAVSSIGFCCGLDDGWGGGTSRPGEGAVSVPARRPASCEMAWWLKANSVLVGLLETGPGASLHGARLRAGRRCAGGPPRRSATIPFERQVPLYHAAPVLRLSGEPTPPPAGLRGVDDKPATVGENQRVTGLRGPMFRLHGGNSCIANAATSRSRRRH